VCYGRERASLWHRTKQENWYINWFIKQGILLGELQYEPPETQRLPNEPLDFKNKTLHSAQKKFFM
jgi:hypothetical protein